LQWEIGLALFDIGQLEQFHGLSDHSLADCQITRKYLEEGTKHRQQSSEDVYLFGRLYAHLGVIAATREKNHAAAIAWFEKAAPLLDRPLPPPAIVNLGRHGETFVSMGISYWEAGRRDEALRLTQKGTDLMAQAVAGRLLDERAMAVPYSNLAAMHRELGHSEEARNAAQTAARYDGTLRK
jgi:tetratricopeptide (TPR) repeat protein